MLNNKPGLSKKEESIPAGKKNSVDDELSYPGAERVVVGAPLLDNNLLYEFEENFPETAFTVPEWRSLFKIQRYLHNNGFAVDKNTILNCADKFPEVAKMLESAGGPELLDRATAIQDTKNFDKYLRKVRDAYDKRMVIKSEEEKLAALKLAAVEEEVEAAQLIKIIDTSSAEIAAKIHRVDSYNLVALNADDFLKETIKARADGKTFNGVKTNMSEFDEMVGGLANGRFYVLGAPTGCGKSLLNISMLASAAYGLRPGDPTSRHLVIDTGELIYKDDFLPRLLANMSGVFEYKISNKTWHENDLDRKRIIDACNRMEKNKNIFWHQMPDFDGPQVRNLIRRMKHKEGIDCVWFDNIKINPSWKASEQYAKIGDLAQYLKDVAVSLEIPVFAFIQLTSDATVTGKKKLGLQEVHVDMFAGGRRVLQNADMGLTMDYFDLEDPFNDARKVRIGKSRFTPWHRVGEYFEVTGDLRQCSLMISRNHLARELEGRKQGISQVVADQGQLHTNSSMIGGRTISLPTVKQEAINYSELPDFD